MARKGELKEMDAWEEQIRQNAVSYNVVLFTPGRSSRAKHTTDTLEQAIEYGTTVFDTDEGAGVRSAMIYAVNVDERFALAGTINRAGRKYKAVVPKRH